MEACDLSVGEGGLPLYRVFEGSLERTNGAGREARGMRPLVYRLRWRLEPLLETGVAGFWVNF
jgi:hypothetical protein